MKGFCAAVLLASCGAAGAAEWTETDDKGLRLHALQDGTTTISLVCDSDGLWEPPEYHLVLQDGGGGFGTGEIQVSKDELTLTLALSGGAILSTDRTAWNVLIDLLSKPGPVTFAAAGRRVVVSSTEGLVSRCKRDARP